MTYLFVSPRTFHGSGSCESPHLTREKPTLNTIRTTATINSAAKYLRFIFHLLTWARVFKRHFSIGTTSLGMRTLLFDLLLQVMGTSIMTNPFLCAFAMSSESNANPSQVIVSEFHISRQNTLQPH